MRSLPLLPLAALAAAALWAPAPQAAGQGHGPAQLFEARCAHCHTVPDPAIRTDRAWLDQVNRTT